MKHIEYGHQRNRALVETLGIYVHDVVTGRRRIPHEPPAGRQLGRRLLTVAGWVLAVAIQAALLWLVSELAETCYAIVELYLELADMQLDMTSLYIKASSI